MGKLFADPYAVLLGIVVERERLSQGWNQARLAAEATVSPAAVSHVERGARSPRLVTIVRLGKALHGIPAELMEDVQLLEEDYCEVMRGIELSAEGPDSWDADNSWLTVEQKRDLVSELNRRGARVPGDLLPEQAVGRVYPGHPDDRVYAALLIDAGVGGMAARAVARKVASRACLSFEEVVRRCLAEHRVDARPPTEDEPRCDLLWEHDGQTVVAVIQRTPFQMGPGDPAYMHGLCRTLESQNRSQPSAAVIPVLIVNSEVDPQLRRLSDAAGVTVLVLDQFGQLKGPVLRVAPDLPSPSRFAGLRTRGMLKR